MSNPEQNNDQEVSSPLWLSQLVQLVEHGVDSQPTEGAQMFVTTPEGEEIYRKPIARHVRLEGETLWFREILGTGPEFSDDQCRIRAVEMDSAEWVDGGLTVQFDQGTARFEKALPEHCESLHAWDVFYYMMLSCADQNMLDELDVVQWWPDSDYNPPPRETFTGP